MKKLSYILSLGIAALMGSCSNIDEADRLVYVAPAEVKRNVLIEDFTGQACVNCPEAAATIEELQEQYGENVIAVGIYSGPFGDPDLGSQKSKTLVTETGKEYWDHWFSSTQGQPVGLVNRGGATTDWAEAVSKALSVPTLVSLSAVCEYHAESREADFHVLTKGMVGQNVNLQLWLIENNVTGYQKMPDQSRNMNYSHQHVFRAAVNGTWGEPFTFGEEEKTFEYTYSLDEKWVVENMKLVAFVYNDKGVEQVISVPIVAAPESEE